MGLLLSDTTLIDPLLDDVLRLLDCLREWPDESMAARDPYEDQAREPNA